MTARTSDRLENFKSGRSSRPGWWKNGLLLVTVALVLLVVWTAWDRQAIQSLREEARPLPFFAVMTLLPALGFPITPFFVVAGATFGQQLGMVGSGIALGLNLVLCYWVGFSLGERLVPLLRRFGYSAPRFGHGDRGAVRFTLAVKFAPGIPAFLKNYGLAMAGVPFPVYIALSMLITGVYGAGLIVFGESLFAHKTGPLLWIAAGLLLASGIGWWWRRRRRGMSTSAE